MNSKYFIVSPNECSVVHSVQQRPRDEIKSCWTICRTIFLMVTLTLLLLFCIAVALFFLRPFGKHQNNASKVALKLTSNISSFKKPTPTSSGVQQVEILKDDNNQSYDQNVVLVPKMGSPEDYIGVTDVPMVTYTTTVKPMETNKVKAPKRHKQINLLMISERQSNIHARMLKDMFKQDERVAMVLNVYSSELEELHKLKFAVSKFDFLIPLITKNYFHVVDDKNKLPSYKSVKKSWKLHQKLIKLMINKKGRKKPACRSPDLFMLSIRDKHFSEESWIDRYFFYKESFIDAINNTEIMVDKLERMLNLRTHVKC